MNFLALVKSVCRRVDVPEPDSVSGNPPRQILRLIDVVNEAYAVVWNSLYPKNEAAEAEASVTVLAGTTSVAMPFPQITQVAYNNEPPLTIQTWSDYEQYVRDYSFVEMNDVDRYGPDICAIYGGNLYVWPERQNDITLTVRGNRGFVRLVEDDDVPLLNEQHHDVIVMLARGLELQYQADPTAEAVKADALMYLKQVKNINRGHRERPPRIKRMDELFVPNNRWRLRECH